MSSKGIQTPEAKPLQAPAQQAASMADMCSVKLYFPVNEMENFRYLSGIVKIAPRELMAHFIRQGFGGLYTQMTKEIKNVEQANKQEVTGKTAEVTTLTQEPASDVPSTEATIS